MSISPLASNSRSKSPCRAKRSSMWSRNGTEVQTFASPFPSIARESLIWVSLVTLSRGAFLAMGSPPIHELARLSAEQRLFQADAHRFPVRLQPLHPRNPHDILAKPLQPRCGKIDDGRF